MGTNPAQISYWQQVRLRLAEVAPLVLIVCLPISVHAGFLAGLFSVTQEPVVAEIAEVEVPTSPDTVALLSAAAHSDPQAAQGGGDVLYDSGALVAHGPASPDDIAEGATAGEISVYTVRPGDTPSQIAQMYDVSVNTIFWANDIEGGVLQPGDTLVILPITGVRHIVKSGETLSTIVDKYDGDIDEVVAYNQLASVDAISPGDTVVIPNGEVETTSRRVASAPSPVKVSGSVSSGGGFAHPLPGAVRTQGIHGYNAVDYGAPVGTPIRAAAAGEVIVSKGSGWNGGYGRYIVIKHPNGTQTLYAHNSSNAVGVGAYVNQGEVIGYVGNSGRSTGPHLHFEIRGAKNPF